MNNPIAYNISNNDFYVWTSKFGIKYMKYFGTPEDAINYIKDNVHRCFHISEKQFMHYEKWIKSAKQEQDKYFYKRSYANSQQTKKEDNNINKEKTNNFSNIQKHKIITCPSCEYKIKIKLPLPSNIDKCIKCLSRFKLKIDSDDSLYITLIENKTNSSKKTDSIIKTVDDCFSILEISYNANKKDIKTAYKKKMIEHHPDKTMKLGKKLQELAQKEAKNINLAYSMLKEKGYA